MTEARLFRPDFLNTPTADVAVESEGLEEHAAHVGHGADVPTADVAVESVGGKVIL